MAWLAIAASFIKAIFLLMQYLHDRKVSGDNTEQALRELTDALNDRIAAARAARAAPHDGSVRDPNDRG
jgi:hypothetical protein